MAITKQRKSRKDSKKVAHKKKINESEVTQEQVDALQKALCVGPMPGFEMVYITDKELGFPNNFFRIFNLTRKQK